MTIEFDATEPPSGRIITPGGAVAFTGWLDLLRLLEIAASTAERD